MLRNCLDTKPFDCAQDKPSQKIKTAFKFLEIHNLNMKLAELEIRPSRRQVSALHLAHS